MTNGLFWIVAGSALALACMYTQSGGHWASLLHVGSESPLREYIEREIGPVAPRDHRGHDGQLSYLIARDPAGRGGVPDMILALDHNGPSYRYRRILLPALAGGLGLFPPRLTLTMLIALSALGIGLSCAAVADLSFQWRVGGVWPVIAMANGGALISTLILTVDAFALGLALAGLALALRGRVPLAAVVLAGAALTKETYVLVPLGLAASTWLHRRRREAAILALAIAPLALWSAAVMATFPGSAAAGAGNFGPPLIGMVKGITAWVAFERETSEVILAVCVVTALVGTVVGLTRGPDVLRYVVGPWLILATCSSFWVWNKPNNAARAFAILWPLAILGNLAVGRGTFRPIITADAADGYHAGLQRLAGGGDTDP